MSKDKYIDPTIATESDLEPGINQFDGDPIDIVYEGDLKNRLTSRKFLFSIFTALVIMINGVIELEFGKSLDNDSINQLILMTATYVGVEGGADILRSLRT